MVSKEIRFTLRIGEKLNDEIKDVANKKAISKNAVIVNACENLIKNYFKDEPTAEGR